MHLAILIPGESMPMESVRCYGRMMLRLATEPIPGFVQVSQPMHASSILPHARAKLVSMALEAGATHLLFLDSDMTYPAGTAHHLVQQGRPFIAANATTRRPPVRWVAKDKAGEVIDSNTEKGLTRASVCGLAVALVEARVIRAMERPLFNFAYGENGWRGEDVWFCDRAIAAGFQPMVCNDLSRQIGHVGTHVYCGADMVPVIESDGP